MEFPFYSATEDLCKEIGDPNYTVVFESLSQEYEVYYKYPRYDEPTLLTSFKEWGPLAVNYLKQMYFEWRHGVNGKDNKYWLVERELEQERIDAEHERNEVEPWSEEVAHDFYHMSQKRVW